MGVAIMGIIIGRWETIKDNFGYEKVVFEKQ
jgi:hypothetical protein